MATLEPEKSLGGYTLNRRIARGGMGEIWLAERKGISGFSKQVVIKTILEHFIEEPELVRMFLDEGRVAADLSHPNIAQTYDLGEADGIYYIAMEYVHGHDLRELQMAHVVKSQLIPLNLVLRIAAQVCQGLHFAHTLKTPDGKPAGIIHRDISPQNILVTFAGSAKIVDFGIARTIHGVSQTRSGVLKGKCAYMSPEQVQGLELDGRSDIFALGVVIYEILVGKRLFKRDSELATLDAVVRSTVPPPTQIDTSVPRPVEKLVLRALQRDRNKRFRDAREMQLAIEQVMHETGLLASSAHLSAYMHEIFTEDVDANRVKLREIKRKLATDSGRSGAGEDQKLERTKPFEPPGLQDAAKTMGTAMPTRNLMPSDLAAERRQGLWRWLLVALLGGLVAAGGWYLLGLNEQPVGAALDGGQDGGASLADHERRPDLDGAAGPAGEPTNGDAAAAAADPDGPPTPGADAGLSAPGLTDEDQKPSGGKKRRKKTGRRKPDAGPEDLDIILER